MDSWSDFPAAVFRGTLGTPRRALVTGAVLMGIFFLFVPSAFTAFWQAVLAPVAALFLICLIGYTFFVKPSLPKKKSDKK